MNHHRLIVYTTWKGSMALFSHVSVYHGPLLFPTWMSQEVSKKLGPAGYNPISHLQYK